MRLHRIAVVALPLLLAACASQPVNLQGSNINKLNPHSALKADFTGAPVQWGGRIVQVEARADAVCVEMESNRLTTVGRPATDMGYGRFMACSAGFEDPALLAADREATFTGHIEGYEQRVLDGRAYTFATIAVETTQVWPARQSRSLNDDVMPRGSTPAPNPTYARQ
ncbi:MAG TPA: Slp family lipoprotein [Luteimonas sp.]|nr:Slp family lipoprotein [Luteimonas sp.]HRP72170.1 Slp family lipoprotein [Luteimonas sp.]